MGEVSGEAVADVDTGSGQAAAKKGCTDRETWPREEVGMIARGLGVTEFAREGSEGGELSGRSAEAAGAIEEVSWVCGGAAERTTHGSGAEEDDVGENVIGRRFGGVPARQRNFERAGEGEKTIEEAVEPTLVTREGAGQCEGKEGRCGVCAHGGEVAQAAGEGTVSNGQRGMPVTAKVAAFEGEIGCDEDLVLWWGLEDGAVVADA